MTACGVFNQKKQTKGVMATTSKMMTFDEFKVWYAKQDPLLSGRESNVYIPPEERPFIRRDVVREYLEREEFKQYEKDEYNPYKDYIVCKCCGKLLPKTYFYYNTKDGYRHRACVSCETKKKEEQKKRQQQKIQETMTEKKCSHCGKVQPVENYHPNPKMADGLMSICKQCVKDIRMEAVKRKKRDGNPVEVAIVPPPTDVETAATSADYKPVAVEAPKCVEAPAPAPVDVLPTTIEIPAKGWESYVVGYIPDDLLYKELVARGWQGKMSKPLASA